MFFFQCSAGLRDLPSFPTRRSSDLSVLAPPRLQLLALKLPPPGGTLLALQLTVPLGALAEVGVLTVTAAVRTPGTPNAPMSAAARNTVLVACLRAVTGTLPALLRCVLSPL